MLEYFEKINSAKPKGSINLADVTSITDVEADDMQQVKALKNVPAVRRKEKKKKKNKKKKKKKKEKKKEKKREREGRTKEKELEELK